MGFYERYLKACANIGIEPCSQSTANLFGVTRATISSWNTKKMVPKGETIAIIAGELGVSSDYLLGRTDDPTDYANPDLMAEVRDDVLRHFDGNLQKALRAQRAIEADALRERNAPPEILLLFNQLDITDQAEVKGIIKGLLMQAKYKGKKQA